MSDSTAEVARICAQASVITGAAIAIVGGVALVTLGPAAIGGSIGAAVAGGATAVAEAAGISIGGLAVADAAVLGGTGGAIVGGAVGLRYGGKKVVGYVADLTKEQLEYLDSLEFDLDCKEKIQNFLQTLTATSNKLSSATRLISECAAPLKRCIANLVGPYFQDPYRALKELACSIWKIIKEFYRQGEKFASGLVEIVKKLFEKKEFKTILANVSKIEPKTLQPESQEQYNYAEKKLRKMCKVEEFCQPNAAFTEKEKMMDVKFTCDMQKNPSYSDVCEICKKKPASQEQCDFCERSVSSISKQCKVAGCRCWVHLCCQAKSGFAEEGEMMDVKVICDKHRN